jgi:hypothetical protein
MSHRPDLPGGNLQDSGHGDFATNQTTGMEKEMIQKTNSPSNPWLRQIREQLPVNGNTSVDWLVFAHNDPRMLSGLEAALSGTVMAVVSLPQSCWEMDDEMVEEVLQWAISESSVKGVLLVGHSQGGTPEDLVQIMGNTGATRSRSSIDRAASKSPLARAKHAQSKVAGCERHFVNQLEKLGRLAGINHRFLPQPLQTEGLFYRCESGVFCLFDRQNRTFRALLPDASVA